jgi:hypothetical protein
MVNNGLSGSSGRGVFNRVPAPRRFASAVAAAAYDGVMAHGAENRAGGPAPLTAQILSPSGCAGDEPRVQAPVDC